MEVISRKLRDKGLWSLFYCVETKLIPLLASMELQNIRVNTKTLMTFSDILKVGILSNSYLSMCYVMTCRFAIQCTISVGLYPNLVVQHLFTITSVLWFGCYDRSTIFHVVILIIIIDSNVLCGCLIIPPATKLGGGGYTGITMSVCLTSSFGFPAHNCFPFTPIIMKLHMQTPHE